MVNGEWVRRPYGKIEEVEVEAVSLSGFCNRGTAGCEYRCNWGAEGRGVTTSASSLLWGSESTEPWVTIISKPCVIWSVVLCK